MSAKIKCINYVYNQVGTALDKIAMTWRILLPSDYLKYIKAKKIILLRQRVLIRNYL